MFTITAAKLGVSMPVSIQGYTSKFLVGNIVKTVLTSE